MFIIKEGNENQAGTGTPDDVKESIVKWLEKSGYTVRTEEQDKKYFDSKLQTEVNTMFGKTMQEIDSAVEEVSGIKRADGQKSTDFVKSVLESKLKEVTELSEKLKAVEEAGTSGNELAQQYKQEFEDMKAKYVSAQDEMKKALAERDTQMFMSQLDYQLKSDIDSLKSNIVGVSKDILDDVIESRINKFKGKYKAEKWDDKIIFKDENGKTVTSKKDAEPMNSLSILKNEFFSDLVQESRNVTGNGSGATATNTTNSASVGNVDFSLDPSQIKSKVALTEYLSKHENGPKLDSSSKEFTEAYNKSLEILPKNLPLR